MKLRPPPPPEPEPELYGRKRSSRLAIKESQAEEARAQERRKTEQEELNHRLRNGDRNARIDDDERTKRNAAREARRKAQTFASDEEQIAGLNDGAHVLASTEALFLCMFS